MLLFPQVVPNTGKSIVLFGGAAFLLALLAGGTIDRLLVRIVVEFPILLILAAIGTLVINLIAAAGGAIVGGSGLAAALLAAILGWAVSGGGSTSFAGVGYHVLLQPAHAIALAAPWLLGANTARA